MALVCLRRNTKGKQFAFDAVLPRWGYSRRHPYARNPKEYNDWASRVGATRTPGGGSAGR